MVMSEMETKGLADAPQKAVEGEHGHQDEQHANNNSAPPKKTKVDEPVGGQEGDSRWHYIERVISVLTVIGVLAYTVITWRIYVASQQNAREQHRETIAALNRADTANKIARDTARRELRAYLTITQIDVHIVNMNQVQAIVTIENAGRTPAFDFTGWTCLYVGPFRLINGLDYTPQTLPGAGPLQVNSAHTTIGPGGKKEVRNMAFCGRSGVPTAKLTAAELKRLKGGVAAIYLYGRWTYQDAFGVGRYIAYHVINNDSAGLTTNGSTIDMKQGLQGN
jgi:hypothetical protein